MVSEVEKEMGWVRVDKLGENRGCGPPARRGGNVSNGHGRDAPEGVARWERVVLTVQRRNRMVSEVGKEMGWVCAEELVRNRGYDRPARLRRNVSNVVMAPTETMANQSENFRTWPRQKKGPRRGSI